MRPTRNVYIKNLRRLREARGITQGELADLIGVSASTLSQWEGNRVTPTVENLMVLADVFHVSMDYLMGRKTPMAPEDVKPALVAVGGADVVPMRVG